MPLRIAIDARWIFPRLSGIGLYTRELIRHLTATGGGDEYILLFADASVADRTRRETGLDNRDGVFVQRVDYGVFSPASQIRLPRLLRELHADVYHAPNYLLPYPGFRRSRRGAPACVVTFHDLIPLCHPEYAPRARKRWLGPLFRELLRATARRADRVIVPSAATARDVKAHLLRGAASAAGLRVIPEGVDARFSPAASPPAPDAAPTILYVGRFDPYKNVPLLVEAFAAVRARVPQARLRLVGTPDPRYPEARQRAEALGVKDAVDWTGYVNDAALVEAYRGAAVFALPSRCEGFGLTALEALACGTPVVCSTGGSLPEVVGEAALTVPPDDRAALTGALVRVLTDPALAARLRAAGPTRAATFSWARAAAETRAVYGEAAEARR